MKEFNSLEEIKKYYNERTNTYEFVENGKRLDVLFNFNLNINANIIAGDIIAWNITAYDIKAWSIDAKNITAMDITANIIKYHIVCYAYKNIICQAIKGSHKNAKHFCLDGEIIEKQAL